MKPSCSIESVSHTCSSNQLKSELVFQYVGHIKPDILKYQIFQRKPHGNNQIHVEFISENGKSFIKVVLTGGCLVREEAERFSEIILDHLWENDLDRNPVSDTQPDLMSLHDRVDAMQHQINEVAKKANFALDSLAKEPWNWK